MKKTTPRSYGLDFLKVIATLIIVLHHYQQVFNVVFTNHINFCWDWFYWGYMVELFFILSGYFMYKYVDTISSGDFTLSSWVVRRAKRLLPLMAVGAVVYEGFFVLYRQIYHANFASLGTITVWGVVIAALGLQTGGVFENKFVNNPTWYISVLLICYVVFYLITRLAKLLKCKPYYLYVMMVFLGAGIMQSEISYPFLNTYVARGYQCFFLGLLLAQFVQTYGITRKEVLFCSFALLFLTAVLIVMPSILIPDMSQILSFLLYPALIILLESDSVKKLFHPFWGTLGQISFNVYIWHLTVFIAVEVFCGIAGYQLNYTSVSTMYAVAGITVLAGTASHFLVEKRLNRFVDRQISALQDRAARRNAV